LRKNFLFSPLPLTLVIGQEHAISKNTKAKGAQLISVHRRDGKTNRLGLGQRKLQLQAVRKEPAMHNNFLTLSVVIVPPVVWNLL